MAVEIETAPVAKARADAILRALAGNLYAPGWDELRAVGFNGDKGYTVGVEMEMPCGEKFALARIQVVATTEPKPPARDFRADEEGEVGAPEMVIVLHWRAVGTGSDPHFARAKVEMTVNARCVQWVVLGTGSSVVDRLKNVQLFSEPKTKEAT